MSAQFVCCVDSPTTHEYPQSLRHLFNHTVGVVIISLFSLLLPAQGVLKFGSLVSRFYR